MEAPFRIFIGWDPRQPVSYTVLQHSINRAASRPVSICALKIDQLPIDRTGLTPFTFSRFLVPWLCDYEGWALFLDVDMAVTADISWLFDLKDDSHAVMVVDTPERFERASLMLFNCGHPDNRKLTPEYVQETVDPLHKIGWTENIGFLPSNWNFCVFYQEPGTCDIPNLIHYTAGVPAFPEVRGCDFGEEWMLLAKEAMSAVPWKDLMGRSVHVNKVVEWHAQKADVRDGAEGAEPAAPAGNP